MATFILFNITVEKIISEVEKLDQIEQESILAYLRAKQIQKQPRKSLVSVSKPISMARIDTIKHRARRNEGQ